MERHVHGWWNSGGQRDVGGVVNDAHGFVEVVPAVVVNVHTVVVVALGHGAVGETGILIGHDGHNSALIEIHVDQFNRRVSQQIAFERRQRVFKDGTWHGHDQIVGWINTDLNGVREENLLAVFELSNHVVGSRQQAGLVERTRLNHWTGE